MDINETISLNSTITEKNASGVDTPVMYLSATIGSLNMNMNININTVNKDLAAANAADVKTQYESFVAAVKARAIELGYVIF